MWILSLVNKKNLKADSEGSSRTVLLEFERKTTGQASCRISKGARRRELAKREREIAMPFELGVEVRKPCQGKHAWV